jgi:hypothetical protein
MEESSKDTYMQAVGRAIAWTFGLVFLVLAVTALVNQYFEVAFFMTLSTLVAWPPAYRRVTNDYEFDFGGMRPHLIACFLMAAQMSIS